MPNDQISFVLDGEVFIEDFSAAVGAWIEVVQDISAQVDMTGHIRWAIEDLSASSFFGTVRAIYRTEELPVVEEITTRVTRYGRDLRHGNIGAYSHRLRAAGKRITGVIGDRIKAVRFETEKEDTEIYRDPVPLPLDTASPRPAPPPPAGARKVSEAGSYGMIRGRVQSISNRQSLRFTLYEANTDRPVSCYMLPGREDQMREAWGNLAVVSGIVRRDPATGLPMTVRQVETIRVLRATDRQGWREAIGCAPASRGELSPEAAIRRLRDAED